jgi:hypothetical protein
VSVSWVFDAHHEWLEVVGDTITARRCATGYDYESAPGAAESVVFLEGDCSGGVYLRHRRFGAEAMRRLRGREFNPRGLARLAAGDLGLADDRR